MKISTKFLLKYPKLKPWLWFLGLWLGGLLAVTMLTYPIKLLIKLSKG